MLKYWLIALIVVAAPAWAKEAAPVASNQQLEARMMVLATELRCLVCQNQTIADSQADLATDLRKQIREKLKQGMSERQILDFMVERYGDFVLYRPPLKATTVLLWAGPFALLIVAALMLARYIKRRKREVQAGGGELSDEQSLRARRMLDGGGSAP